MSGAGAGDTNGSAGLFDAEGNLKPPGGREQGPPPGSWRALAEEVLGTTERVRLEHLFTEAGMVEWRIRFQHLDPGRYDEIRGALKRAFRSASRVVTIKGAGPRLRERESGEAVVEVDGFRDHHTWMHTFLTRLQRILIEDHRIALYQENESRCGYVVKYGFRFPSGEPLPWDSRDAGA